MALWPALAPLLVEPPQEFLEFRKLLGGESLADPLTALLPHLLVFRVEPLVELGVLRSRVVEDGLTLVLLVGS